MSFRHLAIAAAVVAAVSGASSATAAVSASATVSQFGYTLFDLNPSDGISPGVTFSAGNFNGYGSYTQTSATDPSVGSQNQTTWSQLAFGPTAAATTIGLGSAQASVSGTAASGNMVYRATGESLGSTQVTPSASGTQFSASASTSDFSGLGFSLSPYTLIVFNGTANLLATTTLGAVVFGSFDVRSESASAEVSLRVSGPSNTGGQGQQSSGDNRSLFASYGSTFNPLTGLISYTGQSNSLLGLPMSASFSNFTAGALNGTLNLSVSARGNSPLSPVPEASTAWLMLAGLAGTGWVLRRRR